MWTISLWCCHNVLLFVLKKVSFWSTFVLDNFFCYHFSNYFLCYFYNSYEIPQVLQRRTFQWREDYIEGSPYSGLWWPKFFKKLRIDWLDQCSSFTWFTKLPFSVSLAFNLWNVEMISEPSKYLLLIVGFNQRSVPLLLYGFQWCFYLKDITMGNIVSCWRCAGGKRSMDYIHYSIKKIFVDHGDTETKVEF